jgi:hypothetical protein
MAGLRGFFRKRKISCAGPQHSVRDRAQANGLGLLSSPLLSVAALST